MNRREFLRLTGFAAVASAVGVGSRAFAAERSLGSDDEKPARPNIVFILADDMGYGDVEALSETCKFKTPELNKLVAQGMVFTEAHSGSAVCSPTRYGVLTGRYAWRTYLKRGVLMNPYRDEPLIEVGRETVASFLKKQGYVTGAIGKWHLGMKLPSTDGKPTTDRTVDWKGKIERSPITNGFDSFFGVVGGLDLGPYVWIRNDRFEGAGTVRKVFGRSGPADPAFEAIDGLSTLAKEADAFIDARKGSDRPFFLYYALPAPHTPIVPSKAFQGKSGINKYGDFCMEVDYVVGRVCAALERNGFAENTLVIFTADNGCSPAANTKLLERKGHFPSAGRRGYKADAYDGGHRVPFIARWPGKIKPGSKTGALICLTDFFATCADIVQAPVGNDMAEDSASFLPLLRGKTPPQPIHEAVVHHSFDGAFAIRQGKWKLILDPGSGGWSAPRTAIARKKKLPEVQLFDMEADPAEKTNLQAQHPEVVKALTALLERYKTSGRSVPMR